MKLSQGVAVSVEDGVLAVSTPNGGRVVLNETGSFVLNKIARGHKVPNTIAALCESYDVDFSVAEKDVACFLEQLKEYGVLAGQIESPESADSKVDDTAGSLRDDDVAAQTDVQDKSNPLSLTDEEAVCIE